MSAQIKRFLLSMAYANASAAIEGLGGLLANQDADATGFDDAAAEWFYGVAKGIRVLQQGQMPDAIAPTDAATHAALTPVQELDTEEESLLKRVIRLGWADDRIEDLGFDQATIDHYRQQDQSGEEAINLEPNPRLTPPSPPPPTPKARTASARAAATPRGALRPVGAPKKREALNEGR